MKTMTLTFLVLTLSTAAMSQDFQGIVTYEIEIKNPMPDKMPDSIFFARLDGKTTITQVYHYRENQYKSIMGPEKMVQHYDPESKRLYVYRIGSDSATWSDGTKYMDEIISIEKIEETAEVLGEECQAIKIDSKMGETTYYFSKKYKLDAEKFSGHKYGFWEDYLKETGALPMKWVVKSPFSYMISTVTQIEEKELPDDVFALPEFSYVEESPF